MNVELGGAILQRILDAHPGRRQLPSFADRHKRNAEDIRQRRPEDETAGLNPYHSIDLILPAMRCKGVDDMLERISVTQERRDVAEEDAGDGKVWYIPNVGRQIHAEAPYSAIADRHARGVDRCARSEAIECAAGPLTLV